jgi:hypothetical protein
MTQLVANRRVQRKDRLGKITEKGLMVKPQNKEPHLQATLCRLADAASQGDGGLFQGWSPDGRDMPKASFRSSRISLSSLMVILPAFLLRRS